jgi:multiple sugar transport system substrate-binding protein/sn-glycerol 3-phosphate transport system substrate-binding protein
MKKYHTQIALFLILVCVLIGSLLFSSCNTLGLDVHIIPSETPAITRTATPRPKITLTFAPTHTPTQPFHLDLPPSSLKGTQIRFWHPWQGDLARKTTQRVVEFNNTNPWGITVNFYAPGGPAMLVEAVNQSQIDGSLPNVVIAPSAMLSAWQGQYKNLINLDEYIDLQEYGLSDQELADFTPIIWQQDTLNGRRFGYPVQRDAYVLIYNQTWAQELGFSTPPSVPSQFQNQICGAKQALLKDDKSENDGTGGWVVRNDEGTTLSWMLTYQYDGFTALQEDQYAFNEEGAVRTFRFLRYLFDAGCSWNARNPSPYAYFATRQALVFSARLSELPDFRSSMAFYESPDEWIVLPYPSQEKDPITLVEGQSFGIFAASPEEQMASWLFLKWLNSPAYQAEILKDTGSYPVTTSVINELADYMAANPQWAGFVENQTKIQAMPNGIYWSRVRSTIADATWQLYQQSQIEDSSETVNLILTQLDLMIQELIGKAE